MAVWVTWEIAWQWRDVSLERRELAVQATKAKTRTERVVPISTRLLATLEIRKLNPAGEKFGPDAYVFGNEVGEKVKSVRIGWEVTGGKAGLSDLQLRDLRHEAGSRFDEAGVSTNYVSKILGHTSLTTTTRYLNIQRRSLHLAMEKLEQSQRLAAEERRRRAEEKKRQRGSRCTTVAHG
jgi:integrase